MWAKWQNSIKKGSNQGIAQKAGKKVKQCKKSQNGQIL